MCPPPCQSRRPPMHGPFPPHRPTPIRALSPPPCSPGQGRLKRSLPPSLWARPPPAHPSRPGDSDPPPPRTPSSTATSSALTSAAPSAASSAAPSRADKPSSPMVSWSGTTAAGLSSPPDEATSMRDHVLLYLNGRPIRVSGDDAFLT